MSQLVTIRTQPPPPTFFDRARALLRSSWMRLGSLKTKSPEWDRLFGSGYETSSGIVVTDENWMTFSAVFSAVLQISSDVAKVPLNLHKRRKEGGSDHYIDSKLYHLLKSEPNNEQGSMVHRQTLIAHALTCKGGFAEIERDMHGRPAALWTLTPDRVEPFRREQFDRNTGRKTMGPLEYRIDQDDNQILPARDVIHIHGLGYDGYGGYGVINKARQAIALALAMEKFGGQYFGKGTVFGGHLETEDDLDEDQKKDIKANIDAFRAAQDSAWRILVTGAGHKFHQFESKPSDSQMDESRTAQVLEVARFFRMPPFKLGVNTPGTVSYASTEAANTDYYVGCLLDWYTLAEQEYNRKLIPASERRQQFIKHNVNAFMRGDTKARTEFYSGMLDRGVFNADDVLDLEDLNPQPGGIGKMYLVQGAQVPKHQLEKVIDAKITKDKRPPPTPAAPTAADPGEKDAVRDVLTSVTEAMSRLGESVAAMAEHQRNLDAVSADLATERATVAGCQVELSAAQMTAQHRTAERDEAIARALALEATAETAAVDREAHAAAAALARQEASAAIQRAETALVAQQEAETAAGAAAERQLALTAERDAIDAELQTTRARAADLEAQLTSEQATAAVAATERAAATAAAAASLASMQAAQDQATAEVEAIRHQLQVMEVAHAANLGQRDTDLEALRAQLCVAEAILSEPDDDHAGRLVDLTATADRLASELAAAEARAETDRVQHAATIAPVQAALEASEQAHATLQARVVQLEAQTASAESTAQLAQTHLAGERAARIERMTATIAAHRGLIADVLGRMTRRQAQQARTKQVTPDRLRRWLAGVATDETAICQEALLPAIRVRLAAKGSTEDPVRVTTTLVAEHLAAFEILMRDVLDAPAEDFHAELERVLVRWETERPGAVADALLEEEIRHVRAL